MVYTETYKNIDALSTLTESICKIITEIRNVRLGILCIKTTQLKYPKLKANT